MPPQASAARQVLRTIEELEAAWTARFSIAEAGSINDRGKRHLCELEPQKSRPERGRARERRRDEGKKAITSKRGSKARKASSIFCGHNTPCFQIASAKKRRAQKSLHAALCPAGPCRGERVARTPFARDNLTHPPSLDATMPRTLGLSQLGRAARSGTRRLFLSRALTQAYPGAGRGTGGVERVNGRHAKAVPARALALRLPRH